MIANYDLGSQCWFSKIPVGGWFKWRSQFFQKTDSHGAVPDGGSKWNRHIFMLNNAVRPCLPQTEDDNEEDYLNVWMNYANANLTP